MLGIEPGAAGSKSKYVRHGDLLPLPPSHILTYKNSSLLLGARKEPKFDAEVLSGFLS